MKELQFERRKILENALKGLLLSVGVILTCLVVGIGFYIAREAKSTAIASANALSEFRKEISENTITKFDDTSVKGSDVINFIKKQLGDYEDGEESPIYIKVSTSTFTGTYHNKKYIREMRDITKSRYINPVHSFKGSINRDENSVIIGVEFKEE